MHIKKMLTGFGAWVASILVCFGSYRNIGTSTEPNTWTCNIGGVLAEAAKTGYPILYIDVNSATCGHCHTLNELTLSSSEFKALESDIVFYLVMTDDAQISTMASATIYARYSQYYYGGSGYPLVAVIEKDGSVYGSFNRTDTDVRNVAADLRKLIEELSVKQIGQVLHTDGTGSAADTPPTTVVPSEVQPSSPSTLVGWIATLKGKTSGVVFDEVDNVIGTLTFNCTAKGRANVKVAAISGKRNVKASLTIDSDGNPLLSADGLNLTYDSGNGLWIGTVGGGKAFASKNDAKKYDGLYTLAATSGNGSAGYLTLTAKNGKGRVAGMLNGRNKISVNGVGIVLPAAIVAANIPKWNVGADIALYPVINPAKQVYGALIASGSGAAGIVHAFGADWEASGAKWDVATSLQPLNGQSVKVGGYEIPVVVVSESKIAAGANSYSAKVQAMVRKGTFKGSMKLPEGKLQFEGALIGSGDTLRGVGVSSGAGVYAVTLGNADACDECTVKDK